MCAGGVVTIPFKCSFMSLDSHSLGLNYRMSELGKIINILLCSSPKLVSLMIHEPMSCENPGIKI